MLGKSKQEKILVVLGHPYSKSYNAALANAYVQGARKAGHKVRKLELGKLKYDPVLRHGYHKRMKEEGDIKRIRNDIRWAEHLVFVFPYWWGSMPSLLKGLFDRTFTPGFAFRFRSSWRWEKLLKGRSAHIVVTMDLPPLLDILIWRSRGIYMLKNSLLNFCGISPVRITRIGSVKASDASKREAWLKKLESMGRAAV